jgi:hypothetical protein
MVLGERLFVLIVIGIGLAVSVWLLGLLMAGGINLF